MKKFLLFFSLLSINFFAYSQVEVVQNGDFAIPCCVDIAWTSYPDMYYNISYTNWNSAPGYAYMATASGSSGNNLDGEIEQELTNIPNTITSGVFSFWYSITTTETTTSVEYDYINAYLQIDGTNILLSRITNLNDTNGAYVLKTLNLPTPLIANINNGSNFRLRFVGHTDGGSPSTFRIDDVSLVLNTPSSSGFDLFITNEQVNTNPFQTGDVMEILCTQNFSGSCGCNFLDPSPRVGYFLSTNQTYESGVDLEIGDDGSSIGDNDPDDDESINWTIPSNISSGDYYILFVADVDGEHSETNENNTTSIPVTINNSSNCNGVSIIQQPSSQTSSVGNTATFSVVVTGTTPINYQWKKNGTNISGATNSSYTTPNLDISDNGNIYQCYITNCDGTISSNTATLTVNNNSPSELIIETINSTLQDSKILYSGTSNPNYIKVCADGTKSTRLTLVNNSNVYNNNIGFRVIPDNSDISEYGTFEDISPNGSNNTVVALYTHATTFSNSADFNASRSIEIYDTNNPSNILFTVPLRIYKTPVLMVHGLWGNASGFQEMENHLLSVGFNPDLIFKMNYCDYAGNSFLQNRWVVPYAIEILLQMARNNNYSSGKVDIVAHSMGGVISRNYIQSQFADYPFLENINKLITLNTPHSGSPLGNLALNTNIEDFTEIIDALIIAGWGNFCDPSITDGAAHDLAIGSQAMNDLNNNSINNNTVPSHTVQSKVNLSIIQESILNAIAEILIPELEPNENEYGFIQNLFDGDTHDTVVSTTSQKGGLTGNATQLVNEEIRHIGAQENSEVINHVSFLLQQNPSSSYFEQNGFSPANITANYRTSSINNVMYESSNELIPNSISINTPIDNSSFNVGETINVNITSVNGINRIVFYAFDALNQDYFKQEFLSSQVDSQYTISNDTYEDISFIALGFNDYGLVDYEIKTISVNSNITETGIEFSNSGIHIQKDFIAPISINVTYSNGDRKLLTDLSNVQLTINDNNIAEQFQSNLLKGNNLGSTILNASYSGYSISTPVVVYESNIQMPDISTLSNTDFELPILDQDLIIYPNPNKGEFTIQLDSNFSNEVQIIIYNNQGQQVLSKNNQILKNDKSINLSLDNLRSGLYYLKVLDGKKYKVGKLIIE